MTRDGLLRRRPGIVWREEKPAPGSPTIGPDDAAVTLIHDGMMHQLNPVGAAIWKLADGTLDEGGIVLEVARLFDESPEAVAGDVAEFTALLLEKGWVDRV